MTKQEMIDEIKVQIELENKEEIERYDCALLDVTRNYAYMFFDNLSDYVLDSLYTEIKHVMYQDNGVVSFALGDTATYWLSVQMYRDGVCIYVFDKGNINGVVTHDRNYTEEDMSDVNVILTEYIKNQEK